MAKKVALTTHSRVRAEERLEESKFNLIEKEKMFRNALKNGMYYETYKMKDKKSPFASYLFFHKKPNAKLILYKRIVFVVNKTCDVLITLYPVPDKFIEIYDKYIGDVGLSKPFVVYFKDRNTNKFKPIKNFKNEQQANAFVLEVFFPKGKPTKSKENLEKLSKAKKFKIEQVKKLPLNMPNPDALRF